MASILILGATGMVGSHVLSILRSSSPSSISNIEIIARRSPPPSSTNTIKTNEYIEKDTSKWSSHITATTPAPSILISAIATTRAAAGGFTAQYALEHDLNIELAKAAKEAGTKTYVLISSTGASPNSMLAYPKMKGEIEEDIKALGFEHTVIVRPGLISGRREERRVLEGVIRGVAAVAGKVSTHYLKDGWAQDADVIAKAAINAGLMAERGEVKDKVWVMPGAEIVKYGRTEWKDLKW